MILQNVGFVPVLKTQFDYIWETTTIPGKLWDSSSHYADKIEYYIKTCGDAPSKATDGGKCGSGGKCGGSGDFIVSQSNQQLNIFRHKLTQCINGKEGKPGLPGKPGSYGDFLQEKITIYDIENLWYPNYWLADRNPKKIVGNSDGFPSPYLPSNMIGENGLQGLCYSQSKGCDPDSEQCV